MVASLIVTLWLISVIIAVVWLAGIALRCVLACRLLTSALCRDLMAAGAARLRMGESPCA